ncbi:Protein kinase family protein [Quillaja saponaria]|uniref:Protein kinase family protein n=1 Tax=Quillaja saponaria TaxID=32244 RepID=A0AAD7P904_QUISA|nr:Protein kinase family protein [Quillaja saponaria]KAJ7946858.1 Protein kinase family protein [Quillaja saponaria]
MSRQIEKSSSQRSAAGPVRFNRFESSRSISDSNSGQESPRTSGWSNMPFWLEELKRKNVVSACGIPKYSYKDIQKATSDFTTVIGQGAFGPVYKRLLAAPPVVHHDIKSSNILLDPSMRARVADFGLSRQEMIKPCLSNVRGTFGYLDPEYMSTRTFSKKSDVYSFGVLLFELITGRNPQQGLMEYVELAAMDIEDQVGWDEIVDSQLNGNFDVHKLNNVAALAFKCVNRISGNRPSMRNIVQALSQLHKISHTSKHQKPASPATAEEVSIEVDQLEIQNTMMER